MLNEDLFDDCPDIKERVKRFRRTRHDTMAGDQIDPQRGSFGRRVAFFFGALPGSKWIAKGIPLLPGDGSPHERDLNLLIAPIEVLMVFGS